jgi:hypothetical protein
MDALAVPDHREACKSVGLDLGTDRIGRSRGALRDGGVETDLWGRTT